RWAAQGAAAERALTRQRESLEREAARLEECRRQLQKDHDELAAQQAELTTRQAAWEQHLLEERVEQEKTGQEVQGLRQQRHSYERQLEALREEIERLGRMLLDGSDPAPGAVLKAA